MQTFIRSKLREADQDIAISNEIDSFSAEDSESTDDFERSEEIEFSTEEVASEELEDSLESDMEAIFDSDEEYVEDKPEMEHPEADRVRRPRMKTHRETDGDQYSLEKIGLH